MSTTSFSAIMLLAALAPARADGPPADAAAPAAAPATAEAQPPAGWAPRDAAELASGHPGSGTGFIRPEYTPAPISAWSSGAGLETREPGDELLIVASNGGGDRARFVTLGVYDLMMKAGLWAAVDGLSTVSGSGAAAVAALAASAQQTAAAGGAPTYAVAPNGTRGIITDHPAQGDLGLMFHNSSPEQQHKKATKIILPPFAREWAERPYRGEDRPAGEPLWVPNASTAQAGERVPLTTYVASDPGHFGVTAARMVYLSSAVPGIMPPGEVSAVDGSGDPSMPTPTRRWLVDGAWADRWGVITAVELASAAWMNLRGRSRTVLVVDSRPSPISDGRGAAFSGGGCFERSAARAQLIGYSIEQTRLGTDALAGAAIFGPAPDQAHQALPGPLHSWAPTSPLDETIAAVLKHEGFAYHPIAYGSGRSIDSGAQSVHIERVGADTLLQPKLWDEAKRTDPCARTAARLYTVVAVQPTDFSLRPPMLREGWREASEVVENLDRRPWDDPTYSTRFYPYGACTMRNPGKGEGCERDARAAALAMAGSFGLWLRLDAVRGAVGGAHAAPRPAADAEAMWQMWEGLEGYMNWRSWQAYADFAICLQQNGLDGSKVSGHLDAAKGRDSWNGEKGATIGDPLLDSHTLRVPTSFYPEVHPAPCAGAECAAYALPPIVRVKGGAGGEAGAEELKADHPPTEHCVSRAEGEGLLKGSSSLRSTLFDESGSIKPTEKGAPPSNPSSCPW